MGRQPSEKYDARTPEPATQRWLQHRPGSLILVEDHLYLGKLGRYVISLQIQSVNYLSMARFLGKDGCLRLLPSLERCYQPATPLGRAEHGCGCN